MRGFARIALLVLLSVAAHACGEPYLLRAAYEEARILWRREPIVHVLEREDLDLETHEKLLLVLAARAFAKNELGFEVGNSYSTLARVDGDAVAHVVTAAYRDRLEPYTWRYPIVGRVPYRGFFNPGNAEAYAAELEARGLDTAVWPSTAFSTLGWFDDPLLSNMLESVRDGGDDCVVYTALELGMRMAEEGSAPRGCGRPREHRFECTGGPLDGDSDFPPYLFPWYPCDSLLPEASHAGQTETGRGEPRALCWGATDLIASIPCVVRWGSDSV